MDKMFKKHFDFLILKEGIVTWLVESPLVTLESRAECSLLSNPAF